MAIFKLGLFFLLTICTCITSVATPTTKIIGGENAQQNEFPWVVALVGAFNPDNEKALYCGGAVISSRWVMTAAHCVVLANGLIKSPTGTEVYVGSVVLNSDVGTRVAIDKIVAHPDYFSDEQGLQHNDIALLHLASPIDVTPIKLPTKDIMDQLAPPSTGIISGWGAMHWEWTNKVTGEGIASDFPSTLQFAQVETASQTSCSAKNRHVVNDYMLCAGGSDPITDTCAGDSGGPLMAEVAGQWYQIGITSFGIGCGEPGKYGVYSRVCRFVNWVSQHVDGISASSELCSDIALPPAPDPAVDDTKTNSPDGGGGSSAIMYLILLGLLRRRITNAKLY